MKQYLDLLQKIVEEGVWVENERTKTRCLTLLNHTLTYDVEGEIFPMVTTRKTFWKQAINEMVCYIRGYTDLEDFHKLGVNTWDANCKAWNSRHKQHENDCGIIYGFSASVVGTDYDWVLQQLANNPNDRGVIWNFWNPAYFDQGCLRPCMYSHQFSVLNGKLYLTSVQRSVDSPLGLCFNMIQCYFLLAVTAQLADLKPGKVTHHLVNCHIYENQLELVKEQLKREPYQPPVLVGIDKLTYDDVMFGSVTDKLEVKGYQSHPAIKFPFTV